MDVGDDKAGATSEKNTLCSPRRELPDAEQHAQRESGLLSGSLSDKKNYSSTLSLTSNVGKSEDKKPPLWLCPDSRLLLLGSCFSPPWIYFKTFVSRVFKFETGPYLKPRRLHSPIWYPTNRPAQATGIRDGTADVTRTDNKDSSSTASLCSQVVESEAPVPSLWSSSKRQLFLMAALFVGDMLAYMCLAVMAPFFPGVARNKGMSSEVTGWVFGIFSLVQVFFAPVVGKLMRMVGSRFLLLSGLFFGGGCTILFGTVDRIPFTQDSHMTFTVFCFVLRISLALGITAATTAIFAIAINTFPDRASTALGFIETSIGLGTMMGPVVGGLLYEVGGFQAPFAVVGTAMMLSVLLFYFIVPKDKDDDVVAEPASLLALLKVPVIDLVLVTLVLPGLLGVGFNPILQPHLNQFNLSHVEVGLVFLVFAGTYAILAPISGRIADLMENSTLLMIIGFAVVTVGLLLLGPSKLIGLDSYKKLWLNIVSLVIIGVGISLTLVPTYDKILKAALNAGMKESAATHGLVAGTWTSVFAFGEFLGPIYNGSAYAALGFSWTMTITAGVTFSMFLLTIFIYLYETDACCKWKGRYRGEHIL